MLGLPRGQRYSYRRNRDGYGSLAHHHFGSGLLGWIRHADGNYIVRSLLLRSRVATVTGDDPDRGAFKTPTLRDVARRGPYMHDGSETTLDDVVAYYDRGGVKNPWLSSDMKPLGLTAQERADVVEFMKALTGRIDPEVSRPPDLPK